MSRLIPLVLVLAALTACSQRIDIDYSGPTAEWREVGGDKGGQRFSPLTQISPDNVAHLKRAWVYRSGDIASGDSGSLSALQATPLVVNEMMYFCTPSNRVIALDPETGEERWAFDPQVDTTGVYSLVCRGVAYWEGAAEGQCSRRIFTGTLDARLIALDANTGRPCPDFGEAGEVNLLDNIGEAREAEYYLTSPPLVIGDVVITGSNVKDGQRIDAPGGVVRAFDVHSGELRWAWDPVPPEMDPVTAEEARAGAVFTRGTPNAWGLLSADVEHGIVYVPTGNPAPDHYAGAERRNLDHYGSSVVALDAKTGAVRWHFQTVHHDVWDYDVAAQPSLYSDRGIPAVIAATKTGHLFLLNRLTGRPLYPVEERPVPQTDVPGEWTSKTQPFPTVPAPVHPATLGENDIWGIKGSDKEACLETFRKLRYEGVYTPPSLGGTLAYPGLGGGINWGGVSIDPVANRLVVNVHYTPFTMKLIPRAAAADKLANGTDQLGLNPQEGTPYVIERNAFISPSLTPCIKHPWGVLVAVDLNTGKRLWTRTLGTLNGMAPVIGRFLEWGSPNSGGSIQTASGLVFIAAAMDKYLRAFDAHNGEELWRDELPFAGHAVPATYRLDKNGKQYVVIAAGGHGALGTAPGDAIVAYTLAD